MVRKMILVICTLAALAAVPLGASAATVYDGNISTTYITIFRDIVGKIDLKDDYVFFRSGQYEYSLIAGDLTFDGSTFNADEATQYVIVTNSSYNSSYEYSTGAIRSWSLTPGTALIYSSLGHYPTLVERGDQYELSTLFMLGVILCVLIIRPIFSFTLRER